MKTLVAYFTESGCTRRVAQTIAETTGATLYELKAAQPYSAADLDWRNPESRVNREANDPAARQSVKLADTSFLRCGVRRSPGMVGRRCMADR